MRPLLWIAVATLSSLQCFAQGKLMGMLTCGQSDALSETPDRGSALRVKYWDGQSGYVDQKGAWRIEPHFDIAGDFQEGLAAVERRGKWGYINSSGRYVIPPRFYDAGPFSEGLAAVQPFAAVLAYGFINKAGRLVIPVDYDGVKSFCDGLAAIWRNGKWGYINRKGETVIETKFKGASDFSHGVTHVVIQDEQGQFHDARIDRNGRVLWLSENPLQLID